MKKKAILFPVFLLAGILLPVGCNRNYQEEQEDTRTTQPAPGYYYDGDYEVWVGPGWYYGIYFSNEARYRDWRRRHYWRGYPRYYPRGRYYYWYGGRGRWRGRGRWDGRRGRWRGRGRWDGRRGGRGGRRMDGRRGGGGRRGGAARGGARGGRGRGGGGGRGRR